MGFALNNDGIVGVDLDKCVIDGKPDPAAVEILDSLGCSYIEYSPSGNGLRAFGYGSPVKGTRGKLNGGNVELYSAGRYLTVTGHAIKTEPPSNLTGVPDLVDAVRAVPTEEVQKTTDVIFSTLLCSAVGDALLRFLPSSPGQRNK